MKILGNSHYSVKGKKKQVEEWSLVCLREDPEDGNFWPLLEEFSYPLGLGEKQILPEVLDSLKLR